ncbi:class I tRNA ligase family protein [Candidatus Shikimatogenerans bostrichidophilus]|uniref:class I tRNA ligase family protein n=1 Tax=Candidatus Shikimatogenerans bostrichidophilus TaxID=2943807 RepID=UPI002965F900
MKYNFKNIEEKWIKKHKKINFLKFNKKNKKKFYILNMFPYPSGYGLHVGHTIGYIYSDIIAKYKLRKNYNILNPIGFDSFGLPAEHYAINNNEHPIKIIKKSIKNFKKQIKRLGVFFNWDREITTHSSKYYKWTQWIFIKLFNSWYDKNKAKNINLLIKKIKNKNFYLNKKLIKWNLLDENNKNKILNKFRLIYLKKTYVNWCPKLSTVLSNEEINNGKSIRGGYEIIKKKMLQWHIRITKYCNRLLKDFKYIRWPKKIKNSQKQWIGKKKVNKFYLKNNKVKLKLYCYKKKDINRIKNIIFVAPSTNTDILINNYIKEKNKINNIIKSIYYNKNKKILINTKIYNSNNEKINLYISNYFINKSLNNVYTTTNNNDKFFKLKNNKILNLEKDFNIKNIKINNKNIKKIIIFNLKDIVFSRQRYWGEPIPIYYKHNIPYNIDINSLPLKLPYIKNINILKLKNYDKWAWNNKTNTIVSKKLINNNNHIYKLDVNTMPSVAASNWYYIRFIDPYNNNEIVNSKYIKYWKNVDLYIGGSEHTNGHLLYSRFCYKFLKDIKLLNSKEPFKYFINQGIILYYSNIIYKKKNKNIFVSYDKINNKKYYQKVYVIKDYINNKKYLNINKFIKFNKIYKKYKFKLNNNKKFICKLKLEKMSKSKLNIVNPDEIINKYGIDTLRLYQVFMGPFNKKKIWNVNNIKGIYRFLNKIWNYIINIKDNWFKNKPNFEENYIINKLILKINNDFKNYNLNTSISYLMITLKKIIKIKCKNKKIIKKFIILLSLFAPYISEEIWYLLGNKKSIFFEKNPKINNKYLIKKKNKYIVMINNKKKIIIYVNNKNNNKKYLIKKIINNSYLNVKNYKKIIYIKNKIINILF